MRILAATAIVQAGATFYFFVFWRWFGFWRRQAALFYAMALFTFTGSASPYAWRGAVYAYRFAPP